MHKDLVKICVQGSDVLERTQILIPLALQANTQSPSLVGVRYGGLGSTLQLS